MLGPACTAFRQNLYSWLLAAFQSAKPHRSTVNIFNAYSLRPSENYIAASRLGDEV
jgi:hypothetical protein